MVDDTRPAQPSPAGSGAGSAPVRDRTAAQHGVRESEAGGLPHACEPAAEPRGARTGREVSRRIVGVDVARGLALLGMMAVHILPSTTADGRMSLP